jgi:acyl-CoA-binding protein
LCHVNLSCFYFPSGRVEIPTAQMLRFYAYSSQATEGPCTQPIPYFWQLLKIVKWNAWKKLGNMSKEEAMTKLIELVKQVSFGLLEFHTLSSYFYLLIGNYNDTTILQLYTQ